MVISDLADVTLFSSQTSFVKNKFHQKSSRSLFEKHVPTSRITFLHTCMICASHVSQTDLEYQC